MRRKAFRDGFPLLVAGILIFPTLLCAQKAVSHVRVVRLSYVSGTVGVKRPASTEWAKAQANTPIQEGFEISTAGHSYAEVEFENGSTVRLGESSKVNFDQLALDADGNKLNGLSFEQGYATFHILPEHHDAYTVKMAASTVVPTGKAEFRADLGDGKARVEVFSGAVELTTPSQSVKLGKDKTLAFNPGDTEMALDVKQGIVKDSWDNWTSARDTQAQLAMSDQAVGGPGSMYGWSDLDAYGEWGFFPGFGFGWSPFAASGWSPYSMGMWSFYPGMGYTWIAGEPWGWLPYHYGNWNFASGFGWFWMPGSFNNFSPALVSWYSGPGWLGWAPLGAVGVAGQNMVVAAPGGAVQNGLALNSENVARVPLSAGTRIKTVSFEPGAGAMLSGPPLIAGGKSLFAPHAGVEHTSAPESVLMGGTADRESSARGEHSDHQPLHMRMGTTLGGTYALRGGAGEFRGERLGAAAFSRNSGMGPTLLPHGQQAAMVNRGSGTIRSENWGGMRQAGAPSASVSGSSMSRASSPGPVEHSSSVSASTSTHH